MKGGGKRVRSTDIDHDQLIHVRAGDNTSSDATANKHISNSEMKANRDHRTATGVNAHGETPASIGAAGLDITGVVPLNQLPAAALGGSAYQGNWNASTNTPTLADGVGTIGHYYIVDVPGTTSLGGISSWSLGDWAIYDGAIWKKVPATGQPVDLASTNTVFDRFVSNLIAKRWEDHRLDTADNPHSVTHAQTSPAAADPTDTNTTRNKHVSNADAKANADHRAALAANVHGETPTSIGAIPATDKGANSGVATLGSDGKVPAAQSRVREVATVAALRALATTDLLGHVETQAFATAGDGGSGRWRADATTSVTFSTNYTVNNTYLYSTGHPFKTGDAVTPYNATSGPTLGMPVHTYYVIVIDADTFQLSSNFATSISSNPAGQSFSPVVFTRDFSGRLNYADDGGMVVTPNSNPPDFRWRRMTEGHEIELAWFGPAGNSTGYGVGTDDTTVLQKALIAARGKRLYIGPAYVPPQTPAGYRIIARLPVGANTHVIMHPNAIVRQDTANEMAFDILDAPGCVIEGGNVRYDGPTQVTGSWGNGYRGMSVYGTFSAVYSNSSNTTVRNMKVNGFYQAVTYWSWNTLAATSVYDYALKNMKIENLDISGMAIGALVTSLDGFTYKNISSDIIQWTNPVEGGTNPAPGHTLYVSATPSVTGGKNKGLDVDGVYQRSTTAYSVLKFGECYGGTVDNIYGYGTRGLITTGQFSNMHVGTMVADQDVSDYSTDGPAVTMYTTGAPTNISNTTFDNIVVNKAAQGAGPVVLLDGQDVLVQNLIVNDNAQSDLAGQGSVQIYGTRVRVKRFTYRNAGTGRTDAALRFNSTAVDCVLEDPDIANCKSGVLFQTGHTRCTLANYDPEKLAIDGTPSSSQAPVLMFTPSSGTMPAIKPRPYRGLYTVSASPVSVVAPNQTIAALNVTTASPITVSNPIAGFYPYELTFEIINSSGGTMGALTWSSAYILDHAWVNPINGAKTIITFISDGTNLYEKSRSAQVTSGTPTPVDPFGIPFTVDPRIINASGAPSANRCYYMRCYGSGTISKIGMWIGTSSGNLAVAVYANSGSGNSSVPGARQITSGSVASPGTGYQEISLGGSITVNQGDWLAVACDNTSIALGLAPQSGSIASLVKGVYAYQDTAFPPPSPPASLQNSASGRMFCLVGVT